MAYLRIETRDGIQRIPLDRDRLRIGRLSSNDVILPYQQVSREHAEVERAGNVWWISDLDSTNGLQVGGRQVVRYPLQPGERVYLAPDIVVSLAADDEDFAALATTQMGVAGALADPARDPAASSGPPDWQSAPPLVLRLGRDGIQAPFSLPARPLAAPAASAPAASTPAARSRRGARSDEGNAEYGADTWRASGSGASWPVWGDRAAPQGSDDLEGDLFRRKRAPSRVPRDRRGERGQAAAGTVTLHVCQTCGQLTPADGIRCQFCHNPLALPCPRCGMNLLPAQDYCPRCQTPNPGAARRGRAPSR